MARRWPRAVLALSVIAAFAVVPAAPTQAATLQWTATCGNNTVDENPIPRADGVQPIAGSGCTGGLTITNANMQLTGSAYKIVNGAGWAWLQATDTNGNYTKWVFGAAGEAPGSPQTPSATPATGQATVSVTGAASSGGLPTSFTVTSSPGGLTCTIGSPTGTPRAGSCTVTGLTNGTAYTFTATASNSYGASSASSSSSSVTPQPPAPDVPQAPTGSAQNASVLVTVTAGSGSGGAPTSFTVTSNPGAQQCTVTSVSGTPRTGSCTVSGLTNGTAYTFTATATNSGGTSSASSASASYTPSSGLPSPPSAPLTPSATAGDAQATVTVTDSGGANPTSFLVTSSPDGLTCSISSPSGNPETGSCTVSGLTNGTAYTFTATATNSGGTSSASSASSAVTPLGTQTITYAQPANQDLGTGSLTVAPTTNASGNSVTLSSSTTGVCTVSGFTITLIATGTCSTTAAAGAYGAYAAASTVTRSFTVSDSGGGGSVTPDSTTPTPTASRKVTLCHRTSSYSNPYVEITVDQNSVIREGHGSHTGGLFPSPDWGDIIPPFDGYAGLNWTPEGQTILTSGCDAAKARGKVTLCHATASTTNPYVLITVDKNAILKKGHGSHTGGLYPTKGWGDIIPPFDAYPGLNWPAGETILGNGCSPNGPVSPDAVVPEQPRCLADNSTKGTPLTREQIVLKPGKNPNQVDIVSKDGEPLTLLSMQVNDPSNSVSVSVASSGADPKQASSWQSPSAKDVCWTSGSFGGTDYSYTLPAVSPPSSAGSGAWEYTKAVVSAAGVNPGSGGQAETVFTSPKPGDVVWADVNGNGIFDPSGLMGGRKNTSPVQDQKVTLCHRTRSKTNPYVEITVDKSAVVNQKLGKQEGHGTHTGPLFPATDWGDIIPPFDSYPGMNWPAGRDILESGCTVDDGRDKAVQQVILCAKRVATPEPTVASPICEAPISEPSPTASPTGGSSSTPTPSSSRPGTQGSPAPSSSPSTSGSPSTTNSPSPSTSGSSSGSPSPDASPSASGSPSPSGSPAPTTSSPRPSAASTSSTPPSSGSPSPTTSSPRPSAASASPSPTPSPTPTNATPPPIIINVLPSPSPTPTASTATPTPSQTSSSPSPSSTGTPTPGNSATPTPSSTGTPTPGSSATPTPDASGTTSFPSPSPSGTGSEPGASSSPSSTSSSTSSPDSSQPAGSTGGPTPETSTPGDPGESPLSPLTREGSVKFTVAQGDSTLTFVVPMNRMKDLAAQAGQPALADTGGSRTFTVAAAVVLAAVGLMLLPAVRRRRS